MLWEIANFVLPSKQDIPPRFCPNPLLPLASWMRCRMKLVNYSWRKLMDSISDWYIISTRHSECVCVCVCVYGQFLPLNWGSMRPAVNLLFMFGHSKLKIYCRCLSVSPAMVRYNRWETEQLSQYKMVDLLVCGVMYSNRARRASLPSFHSLGLRIETHYFVFCLFSAVKYRLIGLRFAIIDMESRFSR